MKKHSFFTEIIIFSCLFIGFIVPPLCCQFSVETEVFVDWNINPNAILTLIIGIFIVYFYTEKREYKHFLVKIILPSTFIFCLLFCFSLIFKFFSVVFPIDINNQTIVKLPDSFFKWLICIFQFFTGAFYEEVLYRFYLPEMLKNFICCKNEHKRWCVVSEVFVMLLFAFSHLYLGIFAVLNACAAHVILRFAYKNTKTLVPCVAAHFIYNIISLILL